MADAHNQFALLAHSVDKLHRMLAGVVSLAELAGGSVQSSTETITLEMNCFQHSNRLERLYRWEAANRNPKTTYDRQQTRDERGDQIFSSSGANDRVVSAGNGRSVVGRHHQAHFDELARVRRQSALEPQQRDDASDS